MCLVKTKGSDGKTVEREIKLRPGFTGEIPSKVSVGIEGGEGSQTRVRMGVTLRTPPLKGASGYFRT